MKQNDWVRAFVGVLWIVILTVLPGIILGEATAGPTWFWFLGSLGVSTIVVVLPIAFRWAREYLGPKTPSDPIPWWAVGEALAWSIVLVGTVLGAWLGYYLGPWFGAIGGTILGGVVTYGIILGVVGLWKFFDLHL